MHAHNRLHLAVAAIVLLFCWIGSVPTAKSLSLDEKTCLTRRQWAVRSHQANEEEALLCHPLSGCDVLAV
jgi:hypothetical protein